ncbi:MAG: hypothetical protein ACTSXY_09010 [Promethearchaeota archaeon]
MKNLLELIQRIRTGVNTCNEVVIRSKDDGIIIIVYFDNYNLVWGRTFLRMEIEDIIDSNRVIDSFIFECNKKYTEFKGIYTKGV